MNLKKWILHIIKFVPGVFAAVLLLAGVTAWLAGTQPVLRWVAQQAVVWSAGHLVIGAVHGSLYGPLRIEALSYESGEARFEMKEARLNWSPRALLRRHIQVSELAVQELRVIELKPSEESLALPDTLQLPGRLSIPSATVKRIVLRIGGTEHVLSDLALALEKPAGTYHLTLSGITTPWGRGKAEATLAEAAPFAVSGLARLRQDGGWPYQAEAGVSGILSRLVLKATATSQGGRAVADAILTPFDKRPLAELRVEGSGIDPAKLRKGLPQAGVSALVLLHSQGEHAYVGEISVKNALPGPWDTARLPFRSFVTRFSATAQQAELSGIRLDLAQAGLFEGSGRIEGNRLGLTLGTRGFDPRGVHSQMRSMKLSGDIRLEGDSRTQALLADLHYQRYRLRLDASRRDKTVEIRKAVVRADDSSLSLYGSLSLAEPRRFQLAGALERFDPAAFGDYPHARVNASFTGTGRLAPKPEARLGFAIAGSHLRRQPLSGQGSLNLAAKRIWDSDMVLRLARNELTVKGGFGAPGDRLSFRLDADDLADLAPELAGRVKASGILEGRFAAPSGVFDIEAHALRWRKDYRVTSLMASGRLGQGVSGLLALDASAKDIATPQIRLDQASLVARGRRTQHSLQLELKSPDLDLEGGFSGGWRDQNGWSGKVLSLVNRGRHSLVLKAPARLEVAPERFLLGDARFGFAGGSFSILEAAYRAGQISSRGQFEGLPAAYLLGRSTHLAEIKTDLNLGGEWRFAAHDKVNGRVALWRERGDVFLPTMPQTSLGLNHLRLIIVAADNQMRGQLEAAGSALGSLKAEAQSILSRRDGVWGIAGNAPLQAAADLSLSSVAWVAPLLDKPGALILDGTLKAQLRGSGSFGQPTLSGSLEGTHVKAEFPEQGLLFRDGSFMVELQGQSLQLKSLILRGGEGSLTGQGRFALKGGAAEMQLSLKADKLEVLSRPDRHLTLSGTGEALLAEKKVRLSAKLKADRGLIELPRGDAPSPSQDVVVLGREEKAARKGAPYAMSLDLDLGERFFLKGRGLDAQLVGAVKLVSVDGALPRSSGSIRVHKGMYSAYGQRLDIERGILNFQGPLDNPGLNIVAMRKNQEVEAGVAITGNAQSPRVKLVSNPVVPDSEKLSWLVLGHGVDSSSGPDFSALQAAAGALLGAGESVTLQQRIARAAGLEEVSLKGAGTLESTMLTLGKRLSSRTYLSYEYGLTGAGTLVKINHGLTKRLSVRAQAGATPAVDLFYNFSFD